MGETVDVLVVGMSFWFVTYLGGPKTHLFLAGNYGTGRRSGGVSTLICAVLDDRRVLDDDEDQK